LLAPKAEDLGTKQAENPGGGVRGKLGALGETTGSEHTHKKEKRGTEGRWLKQARKENTRGHQ